MKTLLSALTLLALACGPSIFVGEFAGTVKQVAVCDGFAPVAQDQQGSITVTESLTEMNQFFMTLNSSCFLQGSPVNATEMTFASSSCAPLILSKGGMIASDSTANIGLVFATKKEGVDCVIYTTGLLERQ